MRSAFDAHLVFLRDQDDADYYDGHCQAFEEFLAAAEAAAKQVVGVTPSHTLPCVAAGP